MRTRPGSSSNEQEFDGVHTIDESKSGGKLKTVKTPAPAFLKPVPGTSGERQTERQS
jgi:hypothetical protein